MLCITNVYYITVTYHKMQVRSDQSDRNINYSPLSQIGHILRKINCFHYIPDNESEGDVLGWNKSLW